VIPYDVAVTTTDPAHPLVGPVSCLQPLEFWVPALLLKPEEVCSNYFVEVVEWALSCMCMCTEFETYDLTKISPQILTPNP